MTERFLHAADLHLDTPFEGIGRVAPEVASVLRDASLEAFGALVDVAIERQVAFVVVAGDVYDGPERGVRAQLGFRRGLERLGAAGIDSFVVHGNHDPISPGGWTAVRSWPAGVTVFGTDTVERVAVDRDGHRLATVHGISYARRDVTENLARRFQRSAEAGLHVGVLHCNVGADGDHAPYSPCTVEDLRAAGLDYWALGHVHRRQVVSRHPWAVYPGNLQGRRAGEGGAKGALVVEFDGPVIVGEPEFVALDRVRLESLAVDVAGAESVAEVMALLSAGGDRVQAAAEGRPVVLRAALVGSAPVQGDLSRPGVVDGLLGSLRDEAEGRSPWLWWDAVSDRTRPPLDRDAIRQRGDLAADLIRQAEALVGRPGDRRAFVADALAGLPADLGRLVPELPEGEDCARLDEAVDRALALLAEAGP